MPFKSKAQRRACYAKDTPGWNCGEWEAETPQSLPERVKGSGHTRYNLSQAKKDTRPRNRGRY